MQAALAPVLTLGPEFLSGRRDADDMAHTMVRAVQEYVGDEGTRQPAAAPAGAERAPAPSSRAAQELEAALAEIYACGSGYLADRCDSDCVARTMSEIMGEFGHLVQAG
ncbi:MAG: hypothetical protein L0H79_15060 [Intrasporangium sp.]|uniref:hypothetical protein n=1 Tax=Intrasporangium sp. TaxID=1925024 RepID=UPI002648AB44|nr:hypothetical protein [Intrasporangium sp.]MDN5797060.1 hypothetical protein [Intrasporangium sp.]